MSETLFLTKPWEEFFGVHPAERADTAVGEAARREALEALLVLNEPRSIRQERLLGLRGEPRPDPAIADPRERLRVFYTRGMCSVFAAALHERTGWPIVGFYGRGGRPGREGTAHWACASPAGGYADARGMDRSLAEMEADFGMPLEPHERPPSEMLWRAVRPAALYGEARDHLDVLLPGLDQALRQGTDVEERRPEPSAPAFR